ncbi:hypothetical protein LJR153_007352 [Paenibacillus sp. LjRoot153]|uniref:vWA domain-containing protein n=1 Tax=Paenibacillus sp. LjRoot153 TaxID=3342270 RepID=UPI003ECDD421
MLPASQEVRTVLNTDRFDRRRYEEILNQSQRLQEISEQGDTLLPNFTPLMGDLWAGLFKTSPRLLEEVALDLLPNHALLERIMAEENYQKFRQQTVLNDFASALGTINLSEQVYNWVEEKANQDEVMKQALEQMKQAQQEASEQQQNGSEGQSDSNAQNLQQAAQDLANAMSQAAQDGSLNIMLAKAKQDMNGQQDALRALAGGNMPGDEDRELNKTPLRDKLKLAEKLKSNKKLKKIAEWAGRFRETSLKKQRSKAKESTVKVGVEVGNDLSRILPTELLNFKQLATRPDFMRRFAEGQLSQYEVKGKQELGKGPIICCLDRSSSMDSLDEQSIGFMLALAGIARKQTRDFALIPFNTQVKQQRIWKKGKIPLHEIAELTELFLSGGTRFDTPLTEALNVMSNARFKNADIIFITDGSASDAQWFDVFLDAKRRDGFSMLGIKIGNEGGITLLQKLCDNVVCAEDFTSEATAAAFEI